MTPNDPFVQMKSIEIMDKLPMLTGFYAQVFLTIGTFEVDPIGLSAKDLFRFLGLSRPSVSKALSFLETHELIQGKKDEHGVTRYRTCFGFYYRGASQIDLREHVNTPFTSNSSSSFIESNLDITTPTTSTTEAEKILQAVNLRTVDLDLSQIDEPRAQAIAQYITENPDKRRSPAGWVYTLLKSNPAWQPTPNQDNPPRYYEQMYCRASYSDAAWHRMNPLMRRNIIGAETGDDQDDPHYGCTHG